MNQEGLMKNVEKAAGKMRLPAWCRSIAQILPGSFHLQTAIPAGGSQESILLVLHEPYGYDRRDEGVQPSSGTAHLHDKEVREESVSGLHNEF